MKRLRSLLAPATVESFRPDPGDVPAIVEQTHAATNAPKRSLWERFKEWIRSLLRKPEDETKEGWFSEWLREHLPIGNTINAILYVLLAALVAAIGWVVYSELRGAGLLQRWRERRRAPVAAAPDAAPIAPSLTGASETEAPSILVTLLLGELHRLGRVQDRLSMTHRELGRAARLDAPADNEAFNQVLGAAEQLRYGSSPPASSTLRVVIDAGRRLLESLSSQRRSAA